MYCGIDIGTSYIKCLLVDEQGVRLGLGRAPVALLQGERGYEADPVEWLKATACAYAEASAATGLGSGGVRARLRAVAVSGNGPTLVAVGKDGLPVGQASLWMDRSAIDEAGRASVAAGRTIDPSFYLPKAMRVIESAEGPAVARFFSGPEYLAFTLGARPVTYLPDPYYDSFIWNREIAARLGLGGEMLPPYVEPALKIGSVSVNASEAIGLPAGLPIVSGFPDFLAALVGSGAVMPGVACDRSGSSEALNLCARSPFPDESIFSLPHAVKGLWNLSGGLSTSGKALEWFSGIAGYSGLGTDSVYQDAESAAAGADGLIFLPYLAGERASLWNPRLRAAFVGLSLSHGRKEMARAVVESIAYGLRLAAERIRDGGFSIDLVRCSGGAARDDALCAIKADVIGVSMEVPQNPECEAMGDACACAVALGDYGDLAEASSSMVRVASRFEPDTRSSRFYDERFSAWKAALSAAASLVEQPSAGS
ncbi:MAG: hypothetical protein CVV51_07270 [Spirochaetae bacterium HGW-Spirochaetae-7]|nr:MAG: hypothetical protein CVV51_07270 [Spirochaetae bacterium HGW-Spirochaetae-7]